MKRILCLICFGLLGSLFFFSAGCGKKADSRPKTAAVSGIITMNGQPVADADVVFQPAGQSPAATGRTDGDGNYQLTTFQSDDGAVPGQYLVSVTKYDRPAESASSSSEEYVPPTAASAQASAAPKNLLPEKYASPKTSTLTATVQDGQENQFDFKLE